MFAVLISLHIHFNIHMQHFAFCTYPISVECVFFFWFTVSHDKYNRAQLTHICENLQNNRLAYYIIINSLQFTQRFRYIHNTHIHQVPKKKPRNARTKSPPINHLARKRQNPPVSSLNSSNHKNNNNNIPTCRTDLKLSNRRRRRFWTHRDQERCVCFFSSMY